MHARARRIGALGAMVLTACTARQERAPAVGAEQGRDSLGMRSVERSAGRSIPVDHHIHLLGPGLVRDWKSLGVEFSRPDAVYLSAATWLGPEEADPAVAPAVERAVLVPMAHLYGRSEFREELGLSLEQERERVAAENDHVAREATRCAGRGVALCSVAVLRPYAQEELDRCRAELGTAGVKIHLASSEVDLRDPGHLAAVEQIVAGIEARGEILLLHLDPQRRGLETEDVDRFLDVVLGPHPDLVVIVAHLGGSGGYGAWTRNVFLTVLDWIAERSAAGELWSGFYFDLSAVVLERESEGVPATTPDEAATLAADLRRAGFERLLFGSDAPVFDPRRTAELLVERVGLSPEEMEKLLGNRAPGARAGKLPQG